MNFENLKAASIASNPHKMTSNANIQANVLKILSKLTPETDFMIRCIKELNLTQTDVKPNRIYGYYEFYIAYRNVNNKQLSSEDVVLFSTEMFNYILHDNSRLLRSCKYKNVSVVCNDKLITKEVPIPNAYVPLDDDELNALKSLTKESISSIRYKMDYMETTNESPYSELIDGMRHLVDRPIAARNIEHFYSINDMTGHIIKVSLYPSDNIETINYMAKQELKSKFIKDEFKENCRKSILEQVKDYDFDTAMEKILCKTFKSKDFSENEYIYGKFQFYHSTEPAYELKPDFPNVVACSRSGNSLFFEPAGGRGNDIIPDFKPKAIISKEMSDCFWKSNEIDILLECFNMLLPSRNIFYDPYGEDEDFYNELAELIKTKMENAGLDVIDCEVGYDSDEEKEINIKFKNPVYKQYAQSNG